MSPRYQFTLRTILIITAFVALFLGLRRSYVFTAKPAATSIARAKQMPPLFACLAVTASLVSSAESKFKRSIGLGAVVSTIIAAILTWEFAEGLRGMRYWNWSADWPMFLTIIFGYTLMGGSIGLVVACFHRCWLHFICARNRELRRRNRW